MKAHVFVITRKFT